MMKLMGRCIVQKSRSSSNLGVIAPGCAPRKMWRWESRESQRRRSSLWQTFRTFGAGK